MESVSQAQIRERYERDGFVFPLQAMEDTEVAAFRCQLEELETAEPKTAAYLRGHSNWVFPFVHDVTRHPKIVSAVEAVLGPDLLVWGASFFIKEPHSEAFISWHQDVTYWGLDQESEVTAWLAISDVTRANGCMRFVAASHKQALVPHRQTENEDNLLKYGQEIAVDVKEDEATDVVLKPGEFSLHHGHMFHGSGPNRSGERRIGLAIRYLSTETRPETGRRDYAELVHGRDNYGHFLTPTRPTANLTPEGIASYQAIHEARYS